jgi:Tfp pilus assembly protein PilF
VKDDVVDAAGHALPGHESAVRAAYAAAIERPETATEARIRLGWFLQRVERRDEALARLTEAAAGPIADPALRYLQRLFLGHVLAALGRQDEAIGAFRGALAIVPTAQSARVALMNALLMGGDRAEAEALSERVQSDASHDLDPWWMYWQGQYRLQPQAMARIRELSR